MTGPAGPDSQRETIAQFFRALQDGDCRVLLHVLTPDAITRWP